MAGTESRTRDHVHGMSTSYLVIHKSRSVSLRTGERVLNAFFYNVTIFS